MALAQYPAVLSRMVEIAVESSAGPCSPAVSYLPIMIVIAMRSYKAIDDSTYLFEIHHPSWNISVESIGTGWHPVNV